VIRFNVRLLTSWWGPRAFAVAVFLAGGVAVAGLPVASAAPANADGVDIQAACGSQYPGMVTKATLLDKRNPYTWRCAKEVADKQGKTTMDDSRGVSVAKQCIAQYGAGFVADIRDKSNAYTWYCHPGKVAVSSPVAKPPVPAAPGDTCQCMDYVQRYIGHIGVNSAKDSGPLLIQMGHAETSTPVAGDIIVEQPGSGGAFSDGHIAFVSAYRTDGSTTYVTLRGANQWDKAAALPTDHDCSNVSSWPIHYTGGSGIKYYRR
jgi:hypothetical protein